MNIVQITPGAGAMYCGNCFRDNALVAALRQAGHQALMVPLYLPLTLEEADSSEGVPIFYGGVNVFLEQKYPFFRQTPEWLHRWLSAPALLKWAAGRAAKTRAADVGQLTLSMVRGEEGYQARELDELIRWLKTRGQANVVCLSNAILLGMARRLRSELKAPIVCMLQGEDYFLDALPEPPRRQVWEILGRRAREVDLFIAPSRYFGELMTARLGLPPERVKVIWNGINLDGYEPGANAWDATVDVGKPTLGYFARMCREKGLDTLVEAFLILKTRNRIENLQLTVGGGCGPSDRPFVESLRARLQSRGCLGDAEFHPNLDRPAKLRLLRSMNVLSVPALYGEAFGLYVIEALASGVPVVQPRHASFPELVEATGGGRLCDPGDPQALAEAIEALFADSITTRTLARTGREAVLRDFSIQTMAERVIQAFGEIKPLP